MQAGDVPAIWAGCTTLERDTGYAPKVDVQEGIKILSGGTGNFTGDE
jgi:UDP-glucuronate 4-epimerase